MVTLIAHLGVFLHLFSYITAFSTFFFPSFSPLSNWTFHNFIHDGSYVALSLALCSVYLSFLFFNLNACRHGSRLRRAMSAGGKLSESQRMEPDNLMEATSTVWWIKLLYFLYQNKNSFIFVTFSLLNSEIQKRFLQLCTDDPELCVWLLLL